MTSPINGLVSGLNTSALITSLMQQAAIPQTQLQTQEKREQTIETAYRSVSGSILAVQAAANTLTTASTWQAVTGSSSSSAATVTASTGAVPGTVTFDVTGLAHAQVLTSAVPTSGNVTTGNGLDITLGGKTTHVNVTTDTAAGVASAINGANAGVVASVLNTTNGQILQFSSTQTGTANAFTISGLANPTSVLSAATDAVITVGDPANGGYELSSGNNTFTGVLPGVTIQVGQVASGVTVSTTADVTGIAGQVQTLVSAVNSALSGITSQSSFDTTSVTGGPLNGDPLIRQLSGDLTNAATGTATGYGPLSQLGIQVQSDGTLTFDASTFIAAYKANPSGVQSAISDGFATDYQNLAAQATDPATGNLTMAIQGIDSSITTLNQQIADWTTRLADQRTALQQKFANMETVLGSMKDQGDWLAGQISSMGLTSSSILANNGNSSSSSSSSSSG